MEKYSHVLPKGNQKTVQLQIGILALGPSQRCSNKSVLEARAKKLISRRSVFQYFSRFYFII